MTDAAMHEVSIEVVYRVQGKIARWVARVAQTEDAFGVLRIVDEAIEDAERKRAEVQLQMDANAGRVRTSGPVTQKG
jgi:hypothetical protein